MMEPLTQPKEELEQKSSATSSATQTTPSRVLVCLKWIVDVTEDPELLTDVPERPTPAEWRDATVTDVRHTLDTMLVTKRSTEGLDACLACGLLDVWLPEVAAMVGMGDSEWRHKDVWKHTKQVVRQSVPRLVIRWGALLHDIGKPPTRRVDERGRVTFHGHAELGAKMYRRKVRKRLAFSGELDKRIHFLILHHLRPAHYSEDWTDAAVRRFYKQMGDGLKDLLDLSRADITTKRKEKRRRGVKNIHVLSERVKALKAEDNAPKALPKGLGAVLISELGLPADKRLGNVIRMLEEDVQAGAVGAMLESKDYVEYLQANAERFKINVSKN